MGKITCERGISDRSMQRMTKTSLGLGSKLCFYHERFHKVHRLTEENKRVLLQRCRKLLRLAASQHWERLPFVDEKVFSVHQAHNFQKNRI